MKLTSDFALLSVKIGRDELAAHFEDRPKLGPCPEHLRIPVTIVGYIDAVWGADDGIDQEFSVQVEHLSTHKPIVEFTVACSSAGVGVLPTFDNEAEAIERARIERSINSYARPGAKRLASISRSIMVHEPLFSSTCALPDPEPAA
ncbi:hypothetical protein IB276_33060 [Ensifer sp. ENS04]|uniref:hypothetical protein n=1 Tax=Ensifer sp. ENS04 TaxID=2769281 RepID=UPI00177F16E4|nr:hypothetical protein [Ensifer sp. ENS04]MBD9544277.1 hypothetical protein [Ensifer sp. ENS04]